MSDTVKLSQTALPVSICPPGPPTRLATLNTAGWLGGL
jgi:hypothetical protein